MKYTEIDQNRIIILQKKLQSWPFLERYIRLRTDGHQTEIHTFFIWSPRVGREHNSPSGKKMLSIKTNYSLGYFFSRFQLLKMPDGIDKILQTVCDWKRQTQFSVRSNQPRRENQTIARTEPKKVL